MILVGSMVSMGIGYLFFDSWIGGLSLLPCNGIAIRGYQSYKHQIQRQKMLAEFKELLYALSGNLKAGYSLEHAWMAAEKDLQSLYENGELKRSIQAVSRKLQLHVPLETAVSEFAKQTQLEEVMSFAEVLCTAKRSGGNLIHMMEKTAAVITEKIEVEQEIQTILSGKKLEQRIMCGMPFAMVLYLRLTNPEYLEILYHNWLGVILMTSCLVGTGIAAYWGKRMVSIQV